MRARLQKMVEGESFRCICDTQMAAKMGRVIRLAGGVIENRSSQLQGSIIEVKKSIPDKE